MLVLCDESAITIQRRFRQYYANQKLQKLRETSDNYKTLCDALSHISGRPEGFFDKLKKIRRASVLGDIAQNLDDKMKEKKKDAFAKLKSNNKLKLLENIINKTDDREYNKLKYYLDKWRKQVNKRQKIENKIGALFDKREEKETLLLKLMLTKWLYKAKLIKYDINKVRVGFFCKKILYKLSKEKEMEDTQNKWKKLSYKLLHGDVKLDIKDILEQIKYLFGLKKATKGIVKKNRQNVMKKLLNNDKENKWVDKMKNIIEFMNQNNNNKALHHYLKKWRKANKTMKKKEKSLEEAMDNLDYINKLKKTKTLNDVFLNKKLLNTVKNVKSLIALRRLRTFAKEDKKNKNLSEDLVKAHKEISTEHKTNFMTKLYKLYTYKTLDNFMNKLTKMQLKKALVPKSDFMNKLNLIAINDREFGYKNINKKERQPKVKNLHFKTKEKEISEKDKLDNKLKSNVIAFNIIIPELLDYLNDIFITRKKEVYKKIKYKARSERFVKYVKTYVSKKYYSDKKEFYTILKTNQRIQLTEGPLQCELFKLLRKKVIRTMFDKDDIDDLSILLKTIKLFKITEINKALSEERWLRTLIRKWRFLAFSKTMSKRKLAYLYKHFHVNYLEMANNVFGEQDSNPSVIKEFERFGSNVGIWENEKPDYADQIKHAKSFKRRITFTSPGAIFKKLIHGKEKEKEKEQEQEDEKEILKKKKSKFGKKEKDEDDKKEDEKEIKQKKGRYEKKGKKEDVEEEEEGEDNEEYEERKKRRC
jgi:hypothetical protein